MTRVLLTCFLLLASGAAWGQSPQRPMGLIVPNCGTAPNSGYAVAGSLQFILMDVNGSVCIGGAATPAGTNIIGKVGIDQTTPGTTNGVGLEQIGSTTVLAGAGATGAGSQRTTVAQDTTTLAGSAPGVAGTPSTNVVSVQGVSGGTTISVTPALGHDVGCAGATPANTFSKRFSTNAALRVVTGVAAQTVRICSIAFSSPGVNGAISNFTVVEGTQVTNPCDTARLGMFGGDTVATGWFVQPSAAAQAAYVPVSFGNGRGQVMQTSVTGNDVCVVPTTNVLTGGVITYAITTW